MLHENIHAKTFARMDSAGVDQFQSFAIDQQHFNYMKQIPQHFLRT